MKRVIAVIIALTVLLLCVEPPQRALASGGVLDKNSTGAAVVRVQMRLRELGFLNFKPTGSYKSMTVSAVKAFQTAYREAGYEMQADGRINAECMELLFKYDAKRVSLGGVSIPSGPKHGSSTLVKTGEIVPWATLKGQMTPGRTYVITDCYTGSTFELVYTGGENHAEMEPASKDALEGFKAICGPEYNYLKRPVLVRMDGRDVAASVQCWPHGASTVPDNGMDGHVCLFFDGSTSHVGNLPDVEHTENVYRAAGQ
ncbi:MAG: peptidoglycan-binding protein [Clostridia bacterium]|nr:peptidoglycan-binding protein [Clostridia bacterium]MBR6429536.1 peptidoglycan-binding protein [Clostridia bacterium]